MYTSVSLNTQGSHARWYPHKHKYVCVLVWEEGMCGESNETKQRKLGNGLNEHLAPPGRIWIYTQQL